MLPNATRKNPPATLQRKLLIPRPSPRSEQPTCFPRSTGYLPIPSGIPTAPDYAFRRLALLRPTWHGARPCRSAARSSPWAQRNSCELILLSDLTDLPAHVIATLYRLRWQIELFLRWLKVFASFGHLVNQSPRGITVQFHVAVIATLLMHMASGHTRVSKQTLRVLSLVVHCGYPAQTAARVLARGERERMLERQRRAKNRA